MTHLLLIVATMSAVCDACGRQIQQIPPGTQINQCQKHECPEYVVDRVVEGEYEVRTYPVGWWVGTTNVGTSTRGMFMKLFWFISGSGNDMGMKMSMTAPVIKDTYLAENNDASNVTMSFYIPKAHWSEIPNPKNPEVFVHQLPNLTVFVRAFDGRAKDEDLKEQFDKLTKSISNPTLYREDRWITAGYDEPWRLPASRRNEIWFIAA